MISFLIGEIILLALSLGASTFITMAYTHTTIYTVPQVPAVIGAVLLYSIRLIIRYVIRQENKVRYRRMRADSHIKVFTNPKKSNLWKYLLGIFVIAVILFLLLQCSQMEGLDGYNLPIQLGTR